MVPTILRQVGVRRCAYDTTRGWRTAIVHTTLREVGEHGGNMATQQQVLRFPLFLGFQRLQETHFAAGEDGYGDAVAVEEAVAGAGRATVGRVSGCRPG